MGIEYTFNFKILCPLTKSWLSERKLFPCCCCPELHYLKMRVDTALHRGAFWHFPFRWIYYCRSSKPIGKETGKTHLCALLMEKWERTLIIRQFFYDSKTLWMSWTSWTSWTTQNWMSKLDNCTTFQTILAATGYGRCRVEICLFVLLNTENIF